MTAPFEVLFTVTLYRTGEVRIGGHARNTQAILYALQQIMLAIESGSMVLTEEGEPYGDDYA